jgi:hypothetical protein
MGADAASMGNKAKPGQRDRARVGLLWRGDPAAPVPEPSATRMRSLFAAFAALDIDAAPVVYADEAAETIEERLLGFDGVMVWVDPLSDGKDRSRLDPMLRQLSRAGLWISGHPDVIAKMGVKAVLWRTRALGWGVDTHLYETYEAFCAVFPARLAGSGPRVLKPNRGNGGQGVWKVALADPGPAGPCVDVLAARSDHVEAGVPLGEFIARCRTRFEGGGQLIDQAHQDRVGDGMVRCYLSHAQVVGFSEQFPRSRALADDPTAATFGMASHKDMHDEQAPAFQGLRRSMEAEWVPGLQRILEIRTNDLPVLWDADFLYGPRTPDGEDTFVLCEINASAVAPFPETAAPAIVRNAAERLRAARSARSTLKPRSDP